jgi:hypothetical protein
MCFKTVTQKKMKSKKKEMPDEMPQKDLLEIEKVPCPTEEEFYKAFEDWKTVKIEVYSFTEEQLKIQEERLKQMKELL